MNDDGRHLVIDTIATPKSGSPVRRVLNPVDRAAEILFGLIMVMTFTGSLGVAQAGSADVKGDYRRSNVFDGFDSRAPTFTKNP